MFRTTALTFAFLAAIDHVMFGGVYLRIFKQGLDTLLLHLL
jgi:hypothetical protein